MVRIIIDFSSSQILLKSNSSVFCKHIIIVHISIVEWLEKNFECPCCRIEMISTDELSEAMSKIVNKNGGDEKKEIQIRPNETIITPPSSPISSYYGSP